MDAHLFRRIAPILAARLQGARLERIHQPLPQLTAFSVFGPGGGKQCLLLRADRAEPLLYLDAQNPFPNPAFPPASVMRLRKYCEGRRPGEAAIDWIERRLAFPVPGEGGRVAGYLLLDLKTGPDFLPELPEGFGLEPAWPASSDAAAFAPGPPRTGPETDAPWRRWQVLTPALRRTLALLDEAERAALLVDLESGAGDVFCYMREDGPVLLCAWPLPHSLRPDGCAELAVSPDDPALFGFLRAEGRSRLLAAAASGEQAKADKPRRAENKRRARLAAKLREEHARLSGLAALREDAVLLQASLWRFPPDVCLATVSLPVAEKPDAALSGAAAQRTLPLNPFLTVTENMQAMFRQSARAARGLAMLEKRMAALDDAPSGGPDRSEPAGPVPSPPAPAAQVPATAPRGVQEFISSDGFVMWRGRNAEGNRQALKHARPHDLWFHGENCPSAHLIVRRDHGEHTVPERTLEEAAILTALKSPYRNDAKAPVMSALAKHVTPVKNGAPGSVRVHVVWRSFFVVLRPELEQTLFRHPRAANDS